jgi:hypothetical protein
VPQRVGVGVAGGGKRKRPFRLTPPDPKEDELQASVANVLHYALHGRPVVWTHFPAGGYELGPGAAARLKRLGLTSGIPDLLFMWSEGRTLWIELKTRTGRVSAAQAAMHEKLRSLGFLVSLCRSIEDVVAALEIASVPMNRVMIHGKRRSSYGEQTAEGRGAAESS